MNPATPKIRIYDLTDFFGGHERKERKNLFHIILTTILTIVLTTILTIVLIKVLTIVLIRVLIRVFNFTIKPEMSDKTRNE